MFISHDVCMYIKIEKVCESGSCTRYADEIRVATCAVSRLENIKYHITKIARIFGQPHLIHRGEKMKRQPFRT